MRYFILSQLWFWCFDIQIHSFFCCSFDDMRKSCSSNHPSSKWRMPIQMGAKPYFCIVEMYRIQFINTDMCIKVFYKLISVIYIDSSSLTVCRINTQLHRKIFEIFCIKQRQLFQITSNLRTLPCRILKHEHRRNFFFFQEITNNFYITHHIFHRFLDISSAFLFTDMDINSIKSCLLCNDKILHNRRNINSCFINRFCEICQVV